MAILEINTPNHSASRTGGVINPRHFLIQNSSNRNSWTNRRRYGI